MNMTCSNVSGLRINEGIKGHCKLTDFIWLQFGSPRHALVAPRVRKVRHVGYIWKMRFIHYVHIEQAYTTNGNPNVSTGGKDNCLCIHGREPGLHNTEQWYVTYVCRARSCGTVIKKFARPFTALMPTCTVFINCLTAQRAVYNYPVQ